MRMPIPKFPFLSRVISVIILTLISLLRVVEMQRQQEELQHISEGHSYWHKYPHILLVQAKVHYLFHVLRTIANLRFFWEDYLNQARS